MQVLPHVSWYRPDEIDDDRAVERGKQRVFRPRGCLIGIGGIVFALVLCCVLAWFVALPRFHDRVEEELTGILSTEVAGVLDREIGSVGSIQAGEYRIPLSDIQRQLTGGSDNLQVEGVFVRAEGNEIIVGFEVPNASAAYRFTPSVSPEGYLRMTDMRGEGGIVEQILAPESIGNAIENAVNRYLQANGLYLEDAYVTGNDLVLRIGER